MKLKLITAVVLGVFVAILIYFFVRGYFYTMPPPTGKPSPAAIAAKKKIAKSGLFNPPAPAIVHR